MSLQDKLNGLMETAAVEPTNEESAGIIEKKQEGTIRMLQAELAAWRQFGDEQLPDILSTIETNTRTDDDVTRATARYSERWFADQALSIDGKTKVASSLLSKAKEYDVSQGIDLWTNIVNGNPDTIMGIRFMQRESE